MSEGKFFSIIIPVYNSKEFIVDTLDSISAQIFSDFEVLMVNDGSYDGTADILLSYTQNDSRFRLLSQNNSGPNVARNLALKEAQGDYLLFLDSDDIFEKNALSRLSNILQARSYDLINFGYEFRDFETGKSIHSSSYTKKELTQPEVFISALVSGGISGVCWNKCIKRSLILDNRIFFTPDRHHGRDILFSRMVCYYSKTALIIPDNLVISRYRVGSYSRNFGEKNIVSAISLIEKHKEFFDGKLSQKLQKQLNISFLRHLRYVFILNSFRAYNYSQFKSNLSILNKSNINFASLDGVNSPKQALVALACKFPNVFWLLSKIAKIFGYQPY